MSAELEEVVVDADRVVVGQTEDVGEDHADSSLEVSGGHPVGALTLG